MSKKFQAMLAYNKPFNLEELRYPVLASPKVDAFRFHGIKGVAMTRQLKPFVNDFVQHVFGRAVFNGLDGELAVGSVTDGATYNRTQSGVTSGDGAPDVKLYVFDSFNYPGLPFEERLSEVKFRIETISTMNVKWEGRYRGLHTFVKRVPQVICGSPKQVHSVEQFYVGQGYEGLILRDPHATYKYGRSTLAEQGMLKLKQFEDDEAQVIDFFELMRNNNPAEVSNLGRTKRSSHQANKEGLGTLGGVIATWGKKVIRVGTGWTRAERDEIWLNRPDYKRRRFTFKYQLNGMKDLPREPVFKCWL